MRKFNVTVNGKTYAVEVEESGEGPVVSSVSAPAGAPVSAPVSAPAPAQPKAAATIGGTQVKSPMPGLILKLTAAAGASVKKGDKLLVLEAMKMENDVYSPCDGAVNFTVKQGDTVETGAVLASVK
jgi:biotin carboxyl carrier protein